MLQHDGIVVDLVAVSERAIERASFAVLADPANREEAVLAASAANWVLVSWGFCDNVGPRPEVERRIRDRGLPTTDVIAAAIDAWRKNKPEVRPDSPPAGADMRILAYLLSREKVRQSRGRAFVTVGSEEMVGSLRIEEDPAGPHTFVQDRKSVV